MADEDSPRPTPQQVTATTHTRHSSSEHRTSQRKETLTIRIQVEAHVGAITNPEAAREAGYAVAIVAREDRPGYPALLVGERIYNASGGTRDKQFCVTANETESHRDGTFGIEEARMFGDLLKKHFVDAKLACIVKVCVTVFKSPETHRHVYTEVVTYQIDPFEWTPRSHGVTTTTHKIPTLGLED